MPRKIGYARVSTADQNLDLQLSALGAAGCFPIFKDQGVSGTHRHRPEFDKALNNTKEGDTIVIWRLDRMSRSLKHLIEINGTLNARRAYFESLTEKIDTSTAMGEFVFHILGAVAQLEREIIRERTLAGMAAAGAKGKFPGRPRKLTDDQIVWAAECLIADQSNPIDIAADLGVHVETLKRYLRSVDSEIRWL